MAPKKKVFGEKAEKFLLQLKKTGKQVLITIENAIFTIPKLCLAMAGEFEILVLIVQIFLVGIAWMWLGHFLMRHMKILRFILHVLNDVAIVVSTIFGDFADGVEAALNVAGKAGNVVGSGINHIGKIFHHGHLVPKIPKIPITKFPVLNFEHFIQSLDDVQDASELCSPFSSLSYEILFPIRYALNNHVCPIVRYMYGTLVYTPFAWLMSMFYFDANPNDPVNGNCTDIEAQYICFFLEFGDVLIYILTPLMLISFFWPFISKFVVAVIKLAEDIFVLVLDLVIDLCKELFEKKKKR